MDEAIAHDEKGFRIRGTQPTRVDAFVDAAFAFVVTLLVVSVGHVPGSVPDLVEAMRGVPAFALSFLLITRFWHTHRQWSRRYALEDAYSVRLSLLLVFVILLYVYPLRMLATLVMASLSGGVLAERQIHIASVGELRALYVTFNLGYAVVVAVFGLLHRHALRHADAIGLSAQERVYTHVAVARYALFLAVALFSLLLALLLPFGARTPWLYPLPGLVFLLTLAARPWLARSERRALAGLDA